MHHNTYNEMRGIVNERKNMKFVFQDTCGSWDYAVGAHLEQEKDGKMSACIYASLTLKGPELLRK